VVSLGIDSRCLAASLFCKEVVRLISKSGLLFTAFYLKQCSSSLQMAYGGVKKPPELLPLPISLTRNAYPRIIPAYHIRIIYRKDDRADLLVKCYLSFFSLSKVIILAKREKYLSKYCDTYPRYGSCSIVGFIKRISSDIDPPILTISPEDPNSPSPGFLHGNPYQAISYLKKVCEKKAKTFCKKKV
jgi:hypothetical protein